MTQCKVENIIFDAGGVLFGIRETRATVMSRVLASQGYSEQKIAAALQHAVEFDKSYLSNNVVVTWSDEKQWLQEKSKSVATDLGGSTTLADQIFHLTFDTFQYQLFDETLSVLDSLAKNYKLYVVSNATASLDWAFDLLGLRSYFEDIIISAYEQMHKPERGIYELAIERFGVEPKFSLFIDDRIENVDMANKVGLKGVHLSRTKGDDLWAIVKKELPSL